VDAANRRQDADQDGAVSPQRVSPAEADCERVMLGPDNPVTRVMRHAHGPGADDPGAHGEAAVEGVMHRRPRKAANSGARQDHRATGSLVWQGYLGDAPWGLYFFAVLTDRPFPGFRPGLLLV